MFQFENNRSKQKHIIERVMIEVKNEDSSRPFTPRQSLFVPGCIKVFGPAQSG